MNENQCTSLYWYGGHWVQCVLQDGHAYPGHFNHVTAWEGR